MKQQRYKNVFEALEDDPAVAENMKIRSRLMMLLSQYIVDEGLTQKQAAALFDVSQPRVSDLVCGKIERSTIDKLVTMLARAGRQVEVKVSSRAA
jgi:predicted XRE-type DNA-binding protein